MDGKDFQVSNFATRTEHVRGHNPCVKGMNVIGLDMGYSGIKSYHNNGRFCFPNFCAKMNGDQFGKLGPHDILYSDGTGEKWMVGSMAIRSLGLENAVTEDTFFGRTHYLRREFTVESRAALALALWDTKTDGSDVVIQTGLPPAYLESEADQRYLRQAMEGSHRFSLSKGEESRTFDITIDSSRMFIMNQPMGTFWSLALDQNLALTRVGIELENAPFLLFDAGYVTLDTFLVHSNHVIKHASEENLGMKRVVSMARDMIRAETGADVSLPAMQEAMRTGYIRKTDLIALKEENIPVAGYIRKANEKVMEEAFEYIRTDLPKIRYLIMTGGAGDAWMPYFKQKLSGLGTVSVLSGGAGGGMEGGVELPGFYANARGYYIYRSNQILLSRRAAQNQAARLDG